MKETRAKTFIEVNCKCPYCNAYLDIIDQDDVRGFMGYALSSEDCNIEITCTDCEEVFLVTDIDF